VNPIIIEALLVRGESGQLRIILGPYCLDFSVEEVLDLEELPLPGGVSKASTIAGRVTLKPGARLLALNSADAYRDVLWNGDIPFALATRSTVIFASDSAMKQREDAFFAARGLMERLS
jgi:hypothetical protein